MEVINFYSVKGGVGKSSLAYLTGQALASKKNKILYVDLDAQCSLTSIFLREKKQYTIYDYLNDSAPIQDCIYNDSEYIDFIPSSLNVFKIQDKIIYSKLERGFKKLNYDYILLDNSPNYSALSVAAIHASSIVLIPTQLSEFDFDSLVFTINQIRDNKESIPINVILNRVSKNESREETLFKNSKFLNTCTVTRFQNQNTIRKYISTKASLDLPRYAKIKESIEIITGSINNIV